MNLQSGGGVVIQSCYEVHGGEKGGQSGGGGE